MSEEESVRTVCCYCDPYDDVYKEGQENPGDSLFLEYAKRAREKGLGANLGAEIPEALTFADINLRARELIGVVLGSLAKYLLFPLSSDEDLRKHKDLDVLILNQHTRMDPKINEWGIDWWVRPEGRPPTNGNVNLWYDIGLKDNEKFFSPGLYLLNEDMLKMIVDFCNTRAKKIYGEGLKLIKKLRNILPVANDFWRGAITWGSLFEVGDFIISSIRRFRAKYWGSSQRFDVFESYETAKEYYLSKGDGGKFVSFLDSEIKKFTCSLENGCLDYGYLAERHNVECVGRTISPIIFSESLIFVEMDNSFNDKFRERFAFGTDFHGNLKSIDKFLAIAKERNVDHVIFGGDIAPKRMAVKFSDGKAVCIGEPGNVVFHESKDLYESGFMLFEEGMDSGVFMELVSVFKKLAERDNYKKETQGNLEFGEILLLEKYKKHIIDFLKNDKGKKMYDFYVAEMKGADGSYSHEEFVDILIDFLKFEYFFCRNLLGSEIYGNIFSEEQNKMRENYFTFKSMKKDNILAYIGEYGTVLVKWEIVYDKLHLYATFQRKKFFDDLICRIRKFKEDFKGTISIILGNDDPVEYVERLQEMEREGLIFGCTNEIIALNDDVEMIGYSSIPSVGVGLYDDWVKAEDDIFNDLEKLGTKRSRKFLIANIHCPPLETKLSKVVMNKRFMDLGSEGFYSCI